MNPAGRLGRAREALVAWLFSLKAERKCSPRGKTALRRGIPSTWEGDILQEMFDCMDRCGPCSPRWGEGLLGAGQLLGRVVQLDPSRAANQFPNF